MSEQFLHGAKVVQIDDGIRPIRTVESAVIGVIGTAPDATGEFPANTPVLVDGPRMAEKLGETGTLRDAYNAIYAQGVNLAIVIRVEEGVDDAATFANVVGTSDAQTGAWALLTASNLTGLTPRILCAPGFAKTGSDDSADALTVALVAIAHRLRAIAVVNGPNTTEAQAITAIGHHGSDRLFSVDPAVRVFDPSIPGNVTRPAAGYVAGVIARTDHEKGFWWSPSNQLIQGIVGTARPIGFALSAFETEANRLNEAGVATIVRQEGFRIWGNRTPATDPVWSFLSVRRTADMIYDSVERSLLWAMDRPFSPQLLRDIQDGVQTYIDQLVALGALLGGRVWLDPELNTAASLSDGKLFLDFDIEPPAPMERIVLRAHRNNGYYEELVGELSASV